MYKKSLIIMSGHSHQHIADKDHQGWVDYNIKMVNFKSINYERNITHEKYS